jgi:hypothetical protein
MYEPLKHPEVKGGCKIGGNKAESYGNPTISGNEYSAENLGGRNMRDVWNISTSKYKGTSKHKGGHTAVWPTKLAERIIDCACPRKICSKCGLPRVRYKNKWSDCGCGAPFNSGVDLDCFWGAGTTGIASMKHGVDVVGCEIKQDYAEESIERIKEEQEHNRSREKTGLKKSRHVKMDEKQSSLDGFATG